jgi:hypothetical protein
MTTDEWPALNKGLSINTGTQLILKSSDATP